MSSRSPTMSSATARRPRTRRRTSSSGSSKIRRGRGRSAREREIRLREGGTIRFTVLGAPPGLPDLLPGRVKPKKVPSGILEKYWDMTARLEGGAYVIRNAVPGTDAVGLRFGTLGGIWVDRVEVPDGGAIDVEAAFVPRR
jgi:hypothetical protein